VTTFNNPALKQLTDQQVRFTPPQRRLEQLSRAERLLLEVEEGRQYPYQYVCFRVTDYRPDSYPDLLIGGADLRHDLRLFIQEVARSIDPRALVAQPVESLTEPVLTLEELSKKLNVSTKTINRWRRRGLIGVPVLCNGRRQVGFLPSLLDLFLAANKDRVEKSARFSQMSEEEKEDILRRARRLSRVAGGNLTEVSRRIARRLGRSPETVRYTIKNFDRRHPEQALFPSVTGPLDDEAKQIIYNSYRRGIAVDQLAKRFRRTRTSMYRVINEVRAQQLLGQPLEYIHHEIFDDPSMEADILAPMPDAEEYEARKHTMSAPKDVPPELASCYDYPLLSKAQEQHLFRKMNFLKYKAGKLREQLDPARARIQDLKQIEDLQRQANDVKDLLIKANLRLVVSVAKKHLYKSDNIWELISDGNLSLMRAVEKFDFGRGNKFSTYATWAIMKNFARSIPEERTRRERYVTGHEDLFEVAPDNRSDEHEAEASAEMAAHQVNRLLQYLQPRERDIIRMRAGLDDHAKNMTLEEIGHELGITKERVRQLNVRAMKKLREIAQEQHLDM
jgi:RNA polymerase sigma factor (sigma-70 family)